MRPLNALFRRRRDCLPPLMGGAANPASRRSALSLVSGSLALLLLVGCVADARESPGQDGADTKELVVFAAASLSGVFQDIGAAFEADNPGVRVRSNFAGSQRLRTQLEFGAKADVFASADDVQMALADAAGLISGEPIPFAANSLVVITPAGETARGAPVHSLGDLSQDGVKVVMAQPEVPAGRYARTVIQNLAADTETFGHQYGERVMANVVSLEANVRAVVHKVALDEADAGFVYATDISGDGVYGKVRALAIPVEANALAVYPAAALKGSRHPELSAAFVDYLTSGDAQTLFREHGFGPPQVPAVKGSAADEGGVSG